MQQAIVTAIFTDRTSKTDGEISISNIIQLSRFATLFGRSDALPQTERDNSHFHDGYSTRVLEFGPPRCTARGSLLHTLVLRVCLVHFVKSCKDVNMAFEVLNEVYLQIFLHRWVVNREMNLMMLINL